MSGRLPWRRAAGQHSFLADLRAILAERNFRRLFATRLISQTGDGMFTASTARTCSSTRRASPTRPPPRPRSPFFTCRTRWSGRSRACSSTAGHAGRSWSGRRRAAGLFVAMATVLVRQGRLGVPLVAVAAVLGVNRFFLSSLSAALPHVVARTSWSWPTRSRRPRHRGVVHRRHRRYRGRHSPPAEVRPGQRSRCWWRQCVSALRRSPRPMRRDLLGPHLGEAHAARAVAELEDVVAGLLAGPRHVWHRRPAGRAQGDQRAPGAVRDLAADVDPAVPELLLSGQQRARGRLKPLPAGVISSAIGYGAAAGSRRS